MAGETIRWDALRRRPLPSEEERRLPALHCGVSHDVRAALSERGPATPVSQLLAPGPIARERSPAIARVPRGTFPRSPRRRISRRRGFPAWPTRWVLGTSPPLPHRCSVFTASHDDAPRV